MGKKTKKTKKRPDVVAVQDLTVSSGLVSDGIKKMFLTSHHGLRVIRFLNSSKIQGFVPYFFMSTFWLQNIGFLFFFPPPQGPGGFRELREAHRNHFHRSWYLSDAVVASYRQKPS